jgi:hypothetical protein
MIRLRRKSSVSDAKSFYTGWLLDAGDREALLRRFPPAYPEVVAHHVTLKFGDKTAAPPTETAGEVIGLADDGHGVQALVVRIAGSTDRPDGGTYHITWSLAEGRKAKESNAVIARRGWTWLPQPIPIRLEPRPFGA